MCASADTELLLLLALTSGRSALRAGVDGGLTTARNGWWRYGHAGVPGRERSEPARGAELSVINVGLQPAGSSSQHSAVLSPPEAGRHVPRCRAISKKQLHNQRRSTYRHNDTEPLTFNIQR